MKSAILAVALLVASAQTVGWVECCCVLICKHHNDPCKDECTQPKQASSHECCQKPASKAPRHDHEKRCSHVEPSSEIVSQGADLPADAPLLTIELPVLPLPAVPGKATRTVPRSEAPRGSPPLLHLLFGALLI